MKWLRKKLLNFVVKHLFNGITEEDILHVQSKSVIIYRGKKLSKVDITKLQAEASSIEGSSLWKLLMVEMKNLANKRIFDKSQTIDDIVFGKAMLYNLDILEKKLQNIKNL